MKATGKRVFVYGAGKVGATLARALRVAGVPVTLRARRAGLPRRIDASVVVLAVRDGDLAATAQVLADARVLRPARGHSIAVVHCAGALGPEVLAPLRAPGVAVAQMHPLLSFASARVAPSLAGAHAQVDGDPAAVRAARALAKRIGMVPRSSPELERALYHTAAALVANGAAALAAAGITLLARAGAEPSEAAAMLGPLLRSVGENLEHLDMPDALTGPVRRGDAQAVARALDALRRVAPEVVPLYVAATRLQVPLARALGEAPAEGLDAIEALVAEPLRTRGRRRRA